MIFPTECADCHRATPLSYHTLQRWHNMCNVKTTATISLEITITMVELDTRGGANNSIANKCLQAMSLIAPNCVPHRQVSELSGGKRTS